jgi:hypothetical protein
MACDRRARLETEQAPDFKKVISIMLTPERGARSRAIRDYLKTNSKAGPKEIVTSLGASGIEVTEGLVSSIKYGKKRTRRGKKSRGKAAVGSRRTRKAVSSSESIRDYMRRYPHAKPNEVRAGLRKEGVKVSRGLISNVKFRVGQQAATPAVRVAARKMSTRKVRAGKSPVTVEQLKEVRRLIDEFGGAGQLRQALETLEQLR